MYSLAKTRNSVFLAKIPFAPELWIANKINGLQAIFHYLTQKTCCETFSCTYLHIIKAITANSLTPSLKAKG